MRRSIHGLEVAVTGPGSDQLLEELLGGFPEGDARTVPQLTIQLGAAHGSPAKGGRPLFYYGVVQATVLDGQVVLSDGASTVRLSPDGARLDVAVASASLADPHTFEHVLVLLALVVALRHRGLFHLHAAALARPDGRSILIAGGAGSGKSTLALALLEHEPLLGWLGDDTAFLAARPGGAALLAFPRPFHLSGATSRAFPRLVPLLGAAYRAGEKRRLDAERAFPGRRRLEAGPPALIILPQVVDQPTTQVRTVTAAEALGELIESSAHLVVDGMPAVRAHLALLAATVDGATCLRVGMGRDLLERPETVARLLLAKAHAPAASPP